MLQNWLFASDYENVINYRSDFSKQIEDKHGATKHLASVLLHLGSFQTPNFLGTIHACIIRILHECVVLIENSVPRATVWHHEALRSEYKPEGHFED